MAWVIWFVVSYLYAHFYRFVHYNFRINLPGLGWLMRHIKRDLVLQVCGVKLYMYSPIAGSNAMQLINCWNEPETHRFFDAVTEGLEVPVTFVDVGANIGEMVMDMARKRCVKYVYAFEPVRDCIQSMTVSVALNAFQNVRIRHTAVSDKVGTARFNYSATNPSCSGIDGSGNETMEVPTTTLDTEFPQHVHNPILLIDVEGAERDVLAGAHQFVQRERPLVVFEYNNVSRSHFNLIQIREVLGFEYEIFRLRQGDGLLDKNFDETWNCVAIHRESLYYEECQSLIIGSSKQCP